MKQVKSYKQLTLTALSEHSPSLLFEALSQSNYSKNRPDESFVEISNRLLGLDMDEKRSEHLAMLMGAMANQYEIFASQDYLLTHELVAFKFLELSSILPETERLANAVSAATQLVLDSEFNLKHLQQSCFSAMYQQCATDRYQDLWVQSINQTDLNKFAGQSLALDAAWVEAKYFQVNNGTILLAVLQRLDVSTKEDIQAEQLQALYEWGEAVMESYSNSGSYTDSISSRLYFELDEALRQRLSRFLLNTANDTAQIEEKLRSCRPFSRDITFDLPSGNITQESFVDDAYAIGSA